MHSYTNETEHIEILANPFSKRFKFKFFYFYNFVTTKQKREKEKNLKKGLCNETPLVSI